MVTLFEAASGKPPDPPNHDKIPKKTRFMCRLFHTHLHLLQHTFCPASKVHGASHCNYSRLELHLLSLGRRRRSQYPQITWGVCLWIRRHIPTRAPYRTPHHSDAEVLFEFSKESNELVGPPRGGRCRGGSRNVEGWGNSLKCKQEKFKVSQFQRFKKVFHVV